MGRLILAAALALAATSASMAQDFNPGTVVGNVFANPASGCGYGYGYSGPGCGDTLAPPSYRHAVRKKSHPGHRAGVAAGEAR